MSNRSATIHKSDAFDANRGLRSVRRRRPASILGWIAWLLIAILFYLIISYVVLPWWYKPVPSDIPPPNANSTTT
ncbi:MAG TPA: hypothetical protein VKN18_10055 [Blastocatellia bacterium]|nr:hypothetical protein [Blastocatellia bacterium]